MHFPVNISFQSRPALPARGGGDRRRGPHRAADRAPVVPEEQQSGASLLSHPAWLGSGTGALRPHPEDPRFSAIPPRQAAGPAGYLEVRSGYPAGGTEIQRQDHGEARGAAAVAGAH